jgi:hypothetical protein
MPRPMSASTTKILCACMLTVSKDYPERRPDLYWNFISTLIETFCAAATTNEGFRGQYRSSVRQSLIDAGGWAISTLNGGRDRPENATESIHSPLSMIPSQASSPVPISPSRTGVIVRCDLCRKAYRGRYGVGNLNRHKKWYHDRDNQNSDYRRCPYCGKLFERPDNALKHSRQSCKQRPGDPDTAGAVELSADP